MNERGNLQIPLPFKYSNLHLPNNRECVFRRTKNTLTRLKSNTFRLQECVKTMTSYIHAGHVEEIARCELKTREGRAWWLPIFPVVHPKKGKVCLAYDSSASYHGTSLNNALLQGPDHNNRIRGVLLRS